MSLNPTDLTGTVPVPKLLAWFGIGTFGLMGMAIIASWAADRQQTHHNSNAIAAIRAEIATQIGDVKREQSAAKSKEQDFIAQFNSLNRKVDDLTAAAVRLELTLAKAGRMP